VEFTSTEPFSMNTRFSIQALSRLSFVLAWLTIGVSLLFLGLLLAKTIFMP
jgi:hypothetical protein